MKFDYENLDWALQKRKEEIIDYLILFGAIFGFLAWSISYAPPTFVRYLELTILGSLIFIYLFRKTIGFRTKMAIILIFIYTLIYSDAYFYGPHSSNTVLLIAGGYASLLAFSRRITLIVYAVSLTIFLGMGFYLVSEGVVYPYPGYESWLIQALLISIVGIPIILYNSIYIKTVEELVFHLKCRNSSLRESKNELKTYQQELENLVKERTKELSEANKRLEQKTKFLQESIIELKQTQKQLIQSEKMASLGILMAGVGHEINNPLNYIQGGYEGLRQLFSEEAKDHAEDAAQYMEIVKDGIGRVTSIVKSLSHVTRHNEIMDEKCDVHQILDHCVVMLHNNTKRKAIITKNFNATSPIIMGNDGKLHQAFLNILSNAEQAIEMDGEIVIETESVNNHLKITISDNGRGISDKDLSKLGDPFFTTKEPGKGTGLGLYITFGILTDHQASWKVESKADQGTSFLITIPIKKTSGLVEENFSNN